MFFKNRGFTESEQKIILFLTVAVLLGSGIRLYQSRWAPLPEPQVKAAQPEEVFEQPVNEETEQTEETSSIQVSDKININQATKEDLIRLPGIGEKTADQIIRYREINGHFSQTEDLMKIKGIGQKKYSQIKDKINI